MRTNFDVIKKNKFTALVALGAAAVTASMHLGWMETDLFAPQALLAITSIGVGKFLYEKNDAGYKPNIVREALIGLAVSAVAYVQIHDQIPMPGVAQLIVDSLIANKAIILGKLIMDTSPMKFVAKQSNKAIASGKNAFKEKVITPNIEKTKEKIKEMRNPAPKVEEDNEFKPLDISKM